MSTLAKAAKDCGVRIYGNQHGTWMQITDEKLATDMEMIANRLGITYEQACLDAIKWYMAKCWDEIEVMTFLELEHEERMAKKNV